LLRQWPTRAVEQLARAHPPPSERGDDLVVRAAGEAVKQDGVAPDADAQRRGAIVMRGAAAHPAATTPCSAKAVDDLPRAALETLRLMALGHDFSTVACLLRAASSPRPCRCISYNFCSLYVLSRFGQRRNRHMLPRIAAIA